MSEKIWFLSEMHVILDLNNMKMFWLSEETSIVFYVNCLDKNETRFILGKFDTLEKALEYLKAIYNELWEK